MFTDKQNQLLKINLDGKRVKSRQQGNISLSYLEGFDIIDTANFAFGYGNWGYEVKELTQVSEEVNQNQNKVIGYKAIVTITVFDARHQHYVVREGYRLRYGHRQGLCFCSRKCRERSSDRWTQEGV